MSFLARIVTWVFDIYALGLLIYAVLSWVDSPQALRLRRGLEPFYAPFLLPLRRALHTVRLGTARVDFSPVVLFIALVLVRNVVRRLLG